MRLIGVNLGPDNLPADPAAAPADPRGNAMCHPILPSSFALREIGGVHLAAAERSSVLDYVLGCICSGKRHLITFCNMHTLSAARTRPGYRETLRHMTVFNDGVGVDLASLLLYGSSFPDNLNGTDFLPELLSKFERPVGVFLVGSPPGTVEIAARRLAERFPMVVIAGTSHGYFSAEQSPALAQAIAASGARLVLVGMGQPQQETWSVDGLAGFDGTIICVGALFDFIAERIPRAPLVLRRWRLEWLFRLAHEPKRLFRRYLLDPVPLIIALLKERYLRG